MSESEPDIEPELSLGERLVAHMRARALAAMEETIGFMEQYRALLEAVGFSRWAAESMTVAYHQNYCNAIDRQAAVALERALAEALAETAAS